MARKQRLSKQDRRCNGMATLAVYGEETANKAYDRTRVNAAARLSRVRKALERVAMFVESGPQTQRTLTNLAGAARAIPEMLNMTRLYYIRPDDQP